MKNFMFIHNPLPMKKMMATLIPLLFCVLMMQAQTAINVMPGSTIPRGDESYALFPNSFDNAKVQVPLYNGDLLAVGLLPGTEVVGIQWEVATDNTPDPSIWDLSMSNDYAGDIVPFGDDIPFLDIPLTTVATNAIDTGQYTGTHTMMFDTPFIWDGMNHLVLQACRVSAAQFVTDQTAVRFGSNSAFLTHYFSEDCSEPIAIYGSSGGTAITLLVNLPPSCTDPSDLAAANITDTLADLSWTENGTATLWDIEYGTTGFTQGIGTTVNGVTNPYTLTGLTASTSYDYYVRADCSGIESAWVGPYNFMTTNPPTPVTSHHFDGINDYATITKNGDGILNDFSNPHDFTIETRFQLHDTPVGNAKLVSKHSSPANGFFMEFVGGTTVLKAGMGWNGTFSNISSSALDLNTWYTAAMVYDQVSNSFKFYIDGVLVGSEVVLSGPYYPETNYNITIAKSLAWEEPSPINVDFFRIWTDQQTAISLDANKEIEVSCSSNNLLLQYPFEEEEGATVMEDCTATGNNGTFNGITTVSCDAPASVLAEVTSSSNVLFSWDAVPDATLYQVKYRPQGTTTWSKFATTHTQRNQSGLQINRTYQYKVRAKCSNGAWSAYTPSTSFPNIYTTADCDEATGVSSIYLDNERFKVRWDDAGEVKAKVRYREVGTNTWLSKNSASDKNYVYIAGLTPNANYEYRVRLNCTGNEWSAYNTLYYHNLDNQLRVSQELTGVRVYPNPARDVLNIAYDNELGSEATIEIFDILGRTIMSEISNDTQTSLNVNQLTRGSYVVSIVVDGKQSIQKFVKH